MRIADRLALHGPQAKPLRRIIGRLLQPAVVENQHFGLAIFEKELAVIGAFEAAGEMAAHAVAKVRPTAKPCDKLQPFGVANNPNGFDTSCGSFTMLKISQGNQQGNFNLVDFPACNQGDCANRPGQNEQLTCYIETGYGCCIKIGDHLTDSEPGNKVGIIKPAIDARFNADTDKRTNICYQKYLADKLGNGQRVLFTPIIATFDVNGKKGVDVIGFAAFFLLDKTARGGQGNVVKGQFINYIIPGDTDDNQPPVNSKLFTLQLIE